MSKRWRGSMGRLFGWFLRPSFTLIFVPDRHGKVRKGDFSRFSLYLCVFLFFTMSFFSVITVGRYIYYSVRESVFSHEHEQFAKEMNDLLSNSGRIMVAQAKFNSALNGLLSDLGLGSAITLDVGVGGPFVPLHSSKDLHIMDIPGFDKIGSDSSEVDVLADLSSNTKTVEKKIRLLTNKVKTFERIVRYIPSIWPLKGSGKELSSRGGVMTIETIPYTPVLATAEGKVAGINFLDKGIKITLLHKYQFISTYSGLFSIAPSVSKGAIVKKGSVIGYVSKSKGSAVLRYGLFIGNSRGIYPLDPLGFSYIGR